MVSGDWVTGCSKTHRGTHATNAYRVRQWIFEMASVESPRDHLSSYPRQPPPLQMFTVVRILAISTHRQSAIPTRNMRTSPFARRLMLQRGGQLAYQQLVMMWRSECCRTACFPDPTLGAYRRCAGQSSYLIVCVFLRLHYCTLRLVCRPT